ncbi:hypothetical protein K450DRAFT_190332 [Umbelopsis ramanniana AG]|uniref:Myb-like domain-containing protein n=1 Tax=Umbelopsis ramanniana AG TaxID=1314678 RepID=A0AAD5HDC4_UMBRA|nr:uncharacterized protein K450DRAFT_190332 [Umbelopsis ramanniana AG]KAI8578043.1 hypothetical protein K450DRAFT_190332 [Umbelopsis ramanniana AG]
MSTLTSLSVNKGNTRFAPKVKPRINRASNDPTKQTSEAVKPTSSQKPADNGKEKEQFSSGRIAKLPVKVTKPQNTTPIIPPTSSARESAGPPSIVATPIPTVQTTSAPKVAPAVHKAAPTAIPTVASAPPVSSAAKPSVRSKIDKARAAATLGKRKADEVASQTKESAVRGTPMSSASKGKEKEKLKAKAAAGKQKVAVSQSKAVEPNEMLSSVSKSTATPDPMNRAVRAGTRLPIVRNREIQTRDAKGKEKEVDPLSRAVKSVDGWKPINARKKPAAVAQVEATSSLEAKAKATKAKATGSTTKAKVTKAKVAASAAKKLTAAAKAKTSSAEKATAKMTTKKTVTTKRTVSRKPRATADVAEASTSASAAAKTVRKPRMAIKRKRVPIIPLKKRKIPILRTPKPKPLPPPLVTLDEFQGDPMVDDFLDRPMSDFIKDDKKGIVSKMFKEFEETRLKKRKREETPHQNAAASTSQTVPDVVMPDIKRQKEEESKPLEDTALEESSYAPQLQFVNGKMVLDTESLAIKRSAMATDIPAEAMEIVEETSMSRVVNSQSYGKKSKSQRWNAEETEKFYNALAQWGTDFEMITRLFPERNRRQIKLKFVREERVAPKKVTDYLIRKIKPVDMEHYMSITGRTFENEMKNMDVDFNNLVPEKMETEAKGETSTAGAEAELEATVPETEPEEEVLGYVDA